MIALAAAAEARLARREIVRLNRKLSLSQIEGPVVERDEKKWLVRVKIGEDPRTGKDILSPWVSPHANSAGADGAYKYSPALPAKGDKMRLHSPSGIVGAASYAVPAHFDEKTKRPAGQKPDEAVVEFDKTRVTRTKDTIVTKTEKTTVTQSKDKIVVKADKEFSLETEKKKIKATKGWEIESDEPRVRGKTTRIYADSIEKMKFIIGGSAYHLKPEALNPTSE
jgi:hypothetical protein